MNNERIDVLAVLDKHVESHMRMAVSDAYSAQEYPKLREARAAVAELIEANRKIVAIYGPLSASMRIGSERREAWRDLFNALARVGGAA